MKADVIHIGNSVQVINPELIVRVGYDFSFEDAKKEVLDTLKDELYTLMRKANLSRWERVEEEIVKSLAYDLIKKKMKRGNERKLHTKIREEFRDKEFKVIGKKNAKTGIYFPPTGGHPPYYDDYEPGGLKECKSHIILELTIPNQLRSKGDDWLIEQHNVKLL